MSISKYEAAVLYDCHKSGNADARYLVMDLDDCSFGICSSNMSGKVKLLLSEKGDGSNLWNMCIEIIRRFIGHEYKFNLEKEVSDQLPKANDAARRYILSNRLMNPELFHFSDESISCSEFEKQTISVKEKLTELLEQFQRRGKDYPFENMRFIILGQAQKMYFADYAIREFFSADPLLPDARFRNPGFSNDYKDIIRIGMQLDDAVGKIKHTYSVKLYNGTENSFASIVLAQKGQDKNNLKKPAFIGPIFISKDDKFHIQIDTMNTDVGVPYDFMSSDCGLTEIAVGIDNDAEMLVIRSFNSPDHICHMQLTQS